MGKPIPYEAAFCQIEPYTQADIDSRLSYLGNMGGRRGGYDWTI